MFGACVNPDLLHAEPYARHGLPVVRFQSALDPLQLKARDHPDVTRERPDPFSGVPEPDHGLLAHALIYKNLDTVVNSGSHNHIVSGPAESGRPLTMTVSGTAYVRVG